MLQNLFTVRIAKAEIPFRLEERGDEISEEGRGGGSEAEERGGGTWQLLELCQKKLECQV
jgi:hypothetical protein